MSHGIDIPWEWNYVSKILILGGDFLCHVKLDRRYTGHHENCLHVSFLLGVTLCLTPLFSVFSLWLNCFQIHCPFITSAIWKYLFSNRFIRVNYSRFVLTIIPRFFFYAASCWRVLSRIPDILIESHNHQEINTLLYRKTVVWEVLQGGTKFVFYNINSNSTLDLLWQLKYMYFASYPN